jgi:hypothetical protein
MNAVAEIFRAGGVEPVESADHGPLIADLERRIGHALPLTFRQLLSLANGEELLGQFSRCDDPIPFRSLGNSRPAHWGFYDPLQQKILPFMIENQGVCTWALPLDHGDDPPVLIEVDSHGPPVWGRLAESFSLWLECQVWDSVADRNTAFAAQAPGLDEASLALLRRRFREGPATYVWPGDRNYRFSNARSKLLLWSREGACDWFISPLPGASLAEVLGELSEVPGLIEALYGVDKAHDAFLHSWKACAPTA